MNPYYRIKSFRKALKVPGRKNALTMIYEYLTYKLTKPELAEQYFNKYLFREAVNNPSDYIVTHKIAEKVWYFNDMNYKFILIDKWIAESFFSQHNITVVRSIAYNINQMFFTSGEPTLVNNSKDFRNYLTGLKDKGLWKSDHLFIKKKDSSYGGRNIYKVSFQDIKDNKTIAESLYQSVIESGFLFQNVVVQHPELNKINPHSLNTLRIDTFTDNEGITRILNTTLKFSSGKTFVDNITSGGMFAGIDMDTGVLHDEAFSEFETGTGEILLSHPLTGFVFKGLRIPFFHQAKQLATDAARLIPRARVIGWDIGITPKGPVLLEGNYFNGLYPFELGRKGHRNNPVFKQLMNELTTYYQNEDLDSLKKKHPLFV